jgi:NAD(P)-dependent dehydrogenase (short-subunit alcohol dehydrogenase family)
LAARSRSGSPLAARRWCASRGGGNAAATAAAIAASGGKAEAAGADVTDAAAVEGLVKSVVEKHGKLDILVSNAGITRESVDAAHEAQRLG